MKRSQKTFFLIVFFIFFVLSCGGGGDNKSTYNDESGTVIIESKDLVNLPDDVADSIINNYSKQYPVVIKNANEMDVKFINDLLDTGLPYTCTDNCQNFRYYGIDIDDNELYQIFGCYQSEPENLTSFINDDNYNYQYLNQWIEENSKRSIESRKKRLSLKGKDDDLYDTFDLLRKGIKHVVEYEFIDASPNVKGTFAIQNCIWSFHSDEKFMNTDSESDYYYIRQQCNFNPVGTIYPVGSNEVISAKDITSLYAVTLLPVLDKEDIYSVYSLPQNLNKQEIITEQFSYNTSGNFGVSGKSFQATVNGSIGFSDSRSFNKSDVEITNDMRKSGAIWYYDFGHLEVTDGYFSDSIKKPPKLSYVSFQPVQQWLFKVSTNNIRSKLNTLVMELHFIVNSQSAECVDNSCDIVNHNPKAYSARFYIPFPYNQNNQHPKATFECISITEFEALKCFVTYSEDIDGKINHYNWYLNDKYLSQGKNLFYKNWEKGLNSGNHNIFLKVTDDGDATSTFGKAFYYKGPELDIAYLIKNFDYQVLQEGAVLLKSNINLILLELEKESTPEYTEMKIGIQNALTLPDNTFQCISQDICPKSYVLIFHKCNDNWGIQVDRQDTPPVGQSGSGMRGIFASFSEINELLSIYLGYFDSCTEEIFVIIVDRETGLYYESNSILVKN